MSKNKIVFISLLLIIIIASFLRLYNITLLPPGLYPDEAMNGNNALEALSPNGSFKIFYPENNGREGLFIDIQAISIAIFGNTPWALRGVSAIFGILTVLGVYFLTKELFRKQPTTDNRQPTTKLNSPEIIALLSSFLIATSFWHINFSRIGFRAIMAPFFLTWALYFLLKAWRNKNYKWMALSGFVFGLGLHSYIAYRATPIIALIIFGYWFFKFKAERIALIKRFTVFVISAVISASPLLYYFIKNPQDFFGRTSQISVFGSLTPLKDLSLNILKTVGMFNFVGDQNWRHNFAGRPELFWPVGIMLLFGIVVGIYYLFKKKNVVEQESIREYKLPFIILFSWMVVASLPIVISNEGLPHALRAIIMIPPVFILAGFGGVWIYEKLLLKFKSKKYLLLATYFLLLILAGEGYYTYFISWGTNQNTPGAFAQNYVDIGKNLNSPELKNYHKYVVVKAGGALVRGIPMPSQTVMYITDTFTPEKQNKKDIYYVLSEDLIPKDTNNYIVFIE